MKRVALAALFLVACARDDARTVRIDTTQPLPPGAYAVVVKDTSTCPATGLWATCSVIKRLDQAGLAPSVIPGKVDMLHFTVFGDPVQLGPSHLTLFVYPDSAARQRDEATLDRTRFVAYDAPVTLKHEATLIHSANLLAILRSTSDHQRERVSDAITAGPPQPQPQPQPLPRKP